MEPQPPGPLAPGPKTLPHLPGPDPPGSPVLGDLLEEVVMGIEEETDARGELVHLQSPLHGRTDIGEPVGQGKGQLLGGRRACFTDMVPADADGIPERKVPGPELEGIHPQPYRGTRWEA